MAAEQIQDLIRRLLPSADEVCLSIRMHRLMLNFTESADFVTFVAAAEGSNNALAIGARFQRHCGSTSINRLVLAASWPHGFDESFGHLFYDLVLCCVARGSVDRSCKNQLFKEIDQLLLAYPITPEE